MGVHTWRIMDSIDVQRLDDQQGATLAREIARKTQAMTAYSSHYYLRTALYAGEVSSILSGAGRFLLPPDDDDCWADVSSITVVSVGSLSCFVGEEEVGLLGGSSIPNSWLFMKTFTPGDDDPRLRIWPLRPFRFP